MRIIFTILLSFIISLSFAELTLPSLIDDNMVLQQNKTNAIWGWATAGDEVTVSFLNKRYTTIVSSTGEWKVLLSPAKAGNGGNMEIAVGKEKKVIKNILIGEVWLCSGQSNMEFPMWGFKDIYAEEISAANDENIRYITIKNEYNNHENKNVNVKSSWHAINASSVENCSAVAYFFAKKLRQKLNVPVGLVISSWGGTPAQSWMDTASLKAFPNYAQLYDNSIRKIDFSRLSEIKNKNDDTYREQVTEASQKFSEFIKIEYDDAGWEKTSLPKSWEYLGHPDLDGVGAYRIAFTLNNGDEKKKAILHLPGIDDVDSTYINGTFLGSKKIWNELRTYGIPANTLKAGKNVITIWVEDTGGGGGLNEDADNFYVQLEDQKIPLKGDARFKLLAPTVSIAAGVNFAALQNQPAVLFNAMIAPLLSCSFRGVIWYQGESNADQYVEYRNLFPALINGWRNRLKEKEMPFLFVQLSSYNPSGQEPVISNWAGLREAQEKALKLPATGMAVSIDVGDEKDIHPKRKKEVGERLAANAFNIVYGFKNEVPAGPMFRSALPSGNSIKITYNNIGKGLELRGDKLFGFSIAGADKIFVPAEAVISGNEVTVFAAATTSPMYVRYAWSNVSMNANLYNKGGFPAAPFRTDSD